VPIWQSGLLDFKDVQEFMSELKTLASGSRSRNNPSGKIEEERFMRTAVIFFVRLAWNRVPVLQERIAAAGRGSGREAAIGRD